MQVGQLDCTCEDVMKIPQAVAERTDRTWSKVGRMAVPACPVPIGYFGQKRKLAFTPAVMTSSSLPLPRLSEKRLVEISAPSVQVLVS